MSRETELAIVRAGPADLERAWTILEEYNDAIGVIARDDRAAFAAYLQPPKAFWLAERDGQVAACVAFRPLADRNGACEVKRLYVRPESRIGGVASALMDAVEEYASTAGFREIYLDTFDALAAAVRFYEKRGYERVERYNDNPQATIFMCRDLRR